MAFAAAAWRGELLTLLALAGSWLAFRFIWRRPFWRLWLPGALVGAAVEYMTEPEWTYSLQIYLWRDISPFVIAGWGIMFSWLVLLSNRCYAALFPSGWGRLSRLGHILTDLLIGLPLFLGNELFGLHVLKVWNYSPMLAWTHMIPLLHYPWEGVVAIFLYVLAIPSAIRHWEPAGDSHG